MNVNKTADRVRDWVNLGGQIVPAFRVDELRRDIREGRIESWDAVHSRYDEMAAAYEEDLLRHAWQVLSMVRPALISGSVERSAAFGEALDEALAVSAWIKEQVFVSRAKDFHDPFRGITYRNPAEMEAVAGRAEDNPFVRLAEEKHQAFSAQIQALKRHLCRTDNEN